MIAVDPCQPLIRLPSNLDSGHSAMAAVGRYAPVPAVLGGTRKSPKAVVRWPRDVGRQALLLPLSAMKGERSSGSQVGLQPPSFCECLAAVSVERGEN